EGHTDLFGGDEYNLDLSRRRAASVRRYLTDVLRLDGKKIVTRGYGKSRPLVKEGGIDEQAPNRRVEIKMRREPPPEETPVVVKPQRPPEPAPAPEPEPPKAVLVKPMRAIPLDEMEEEPAPPPPPRARPVGPVIPRALPVEEPPPRANEVQEEEPPKAEPVDE